MAGPWKFKMRMYMLTCIACIAMLVSNIRQSVADGSMTSIPTIFFLICIGVVIVYTGWCGIHMWITGDPDAIEERENTESAQTEQHITD